MRFRKLISGTCRVDTGEWLDSDEDSAWYAGLREAVQRCRDDDDTRHVAYEDFDAISDTPMHLLDVAAMRAAFPRARFVCTSRTSHEWIASVTEHAKRYHKIGENDRVATVSIVGGRYCTGNVLKLSFE